MSFAPALVLREGDRDRPAELAWLPSVPSILASRRGTFRSVQELTAAIGAFIDAYNDRCRPFTWTKNADQLIGKIKPSKN